eukprot:393017-Amphidinium_carterae.1
MNKIGGLTSRLLRTQAHLPPRHEQLTVALMIRDARRRPTNLYKVILSLGMFGASIRARSETQTFQPQFSDSNSQCSAFEAENGGRTPLCIAACGGHVPVLQALLHAGADKDSK